MNRATFDSGRIEGPSPTRRAIVVGIVVVIALLHAFRAGSYLRGSLRGLYYGYFSDVVIPFGVYFLLCLQDRPPILRDWRARAALVFGIASLAETLQGFGIPFLGRTFDPLDYLMFGAGVLLAAATDRFLFARLVPGWTRATVSPSDAVR